MKFKPGKLYRCPEYFLLLYPTKEKASRARGHSAMDTAGDTGVSPAMAEVIMSYWAKQLNCQVWYSEPGEIFMFLEEYEGLLHILFGEKQGWITHKGYFNIVEANVT